jgi:hypothetical protein
MFKIRMKDKIRETNKKRMKQSDTDKTKSKQKS